MSENGFVSTINKYTRVCGESKSSIDHIFIKTKEYFNLFTPIVLEMYMTDQFPCILQINEATEEKRKGKCQTP